MHIEFIKMRSDAFKLAQMTRILSKVTKVSALEQSLFEQTQSDLATIHDALKRVILIAKPPKVAPIVEEDEEMYLSESTVSTFYGSGINSPK